MKAVATGRIESAPENHNSGEKRQLSAGLRKVEQCAESDRLDGTHASGSGKQPHRDHDHQDRNPL